MKKIISILLSLAILCCLPIAASAEDSPAYYIKTNSDFPGVIYLNPTAQQTDLYDGATVYSEQPAIEEKSNEKSADTDVSAMVNPTYTVTIPSTVELNSTATVSARNVMTEADKAVKVTLSGTNQKDNAFLVTSADGSTIGYQILKSDGSKFAVNNSLLFETDGNTPLTFNQIISNKLYAGSYKGIVNFDISYGSIH